MSNTKEDAAKYAGEMAVGLKKDPLIHSMAMQCYYAGYLKGYESCKQRASEGVKEWINSKGMAVNMGTSPSFLKLIKETWIAARLSAQKEIDELKIAYDELVDDKSETIKQLRDYIAVKNEEITSHKSQVQILKEENQDLIEILNWTLSNLSGGFTSKEIDLIKTFRAKIKQEVKA